MEAVIENGTVAYENWVLAGSPVYRQFWLFNVNNPLEIAQNGSKPIVRQKGPYTYRVRYLPKINITVNLNNTISFLQPYCAYFEPGLSVGTEEDNITFLNLAVAGAPSILPPFLLPLLNNAVKQTNSSLFQTRTVKEMLWGYEDPILKQLRLPDPHTGVFYPYNGTADGYYNIFTGRGNIEKLGIIDRWQGMPVYISLPHFLYGSEALKEAIDGMEPNEEEHSTFLDVEPVTGISLNVAKRLQVNIAVQPSNQIE
ncbi:UNVERIFIED_CONTAM: hypothetical protein FKN15_055211 [Acipenser sinensis]